jgi:hypothetical protein
MASLRGRIGGTESLTKEILYNYRLTRSSLNSLNRGEEPVTVVPNLFTGDSDQASGL